MGHGNEFKFEGAQDQRRVGLNLPEVGRVQEAVFPEFFFQQGQGQRRAVHRQGQLLEEEGHRTDVVFMAVG